MEKRLVAGYEAPSSSGLNKAEDRKPPDLALLKRQFEEARSLTAQARTESLIDQDYYDGHQWTAEERAALQARKQPDIVINRTRVAVNGILGVVQRGKSDPRAFPRTPEDEDVSDVATDVLRYIADFNRFPHLKLECFRDMLVPGSMAALIGVDGDLQVTIEQIRWEEFFYDPRARRSDFRDARYMGIAKWMYGDDVTMLYSSKASGIEAAIQGASMVADVGFNDRPDTAMQSWVDRRQRRLMVVEMYYRRDGKWERCVFHSGEILEEGESPYQDDKGAPTNPIEANSAYVDRNNNRYGAVRDMRGPQDEINKRRSKLLHLINTSQIEAVDPSAISVNADEARAEAARPDGVIPYGWKRVPTTDMATGQSLLLQEAKGEIERLGPNPAVLGRGGTDQSGRALLARQQSGLVELATVFGALDDWELRVYRQCWSRARQYWKAPQYIRVTDDEDAPKYVGLNQPKGMPVPKMDPQTGGPMQDPQTGQPVMTEGPVPQDPNTGQPLSDPMTGHPVFGYKNVVGQMDVDIILDSTPDTANIQQEQFQDLVQLVGSNPTYAQEVPFEVMLELSAVPHKRQLIDRLKKLREEQGAAQAQQAQQMQQLQMAGAQAQVQETQGHAVELQAKAGLHQATAAKNAAEAHAIATGTLHNAYATGSQSVHDANLAAAQVAKENASAGLAQVQAYDTLLQGVHDRQAAANEVDASSGNG